MEKEYSIDTHYAARKLHSLLGVVPLAGFMAEHILLNSLSTTQMGERNFDAVVSFMHGMPYLVLVELFVIVLPLLFHGVYGFVILASGGVNAGQYPYWRNWMYIMQRVSGVIVFIFVAVHLWMFRLKSLFYGTEVNFRLVHDSLQNPLMLAFYILGTVCAAYHLANGLWNFCITWGVTIGPSAQKRCAWICCAAGIGLGAAGVNSLLCFAGRFITIPF